jgi:hypothetical protein
LPSQKQWFLKATNTRIAQHVKLVNNTLANDLFLGLEKKDSDPIEQNQPLLCIRNTINKRLLP